MVSAGQSARAGFMPGEEIAVNTVTADSGTFTTTETQVQSVTAALITGEVYWVHWYVHYGSSVSGDRVTFRIREDNVSGTVLQEIAGNGGANHGASSVGDMMELWVRFTAAATGNKTFSCTMVRASGTGNVQLEGAATRPNYARVLKV